MKLLLTVTLLATFSAGCANEPAVDVASKTKTLTSFSPHDRYIVSFKNSHGKAAAAAAGTVLVDLPSRNAAAVKMSSTAATKLLSNPNIDAIEADEVRYPTAETTPYGITMVQADQVPASPASGDAGRVKVCIIDSGISAGHEDFAGLPLSGTNDPGTGSWNVDGCGHGTHVAGTITAVAGNGLGVVGVAPGAVSVHIVKVFNDTDCGWTYSSSLVAALDACVAAGAKVVSMSLGGDRKNRFEDSAFGDAYANLGVLPIAAAGNDGNTRKSYPASYASVVSVAAVDSAKVVADFSQQNDSVELAAPGVAVLSTYPYVNQLTVGTTVYSANQIEFAATGQVSGALIDGGLCTAAGSWTGKVVLCQRGDISFYDKVLNVQNGGGVAAVLYNNEAGNFNGTLGDGFTSTIVALSISQADGQYLVANSLGQSGDAFSGTGNGYAELNGTSMATPHVSAVAALVWANFPTATNAELRAALTATAEDLGAAGKDNAYGYGLVQTQAALDYLVSGGGGSTSPDSGTGSVDSGTGGSCTLAQLGDSCSSNAECCSNKCKGSPNNKTCK